MFDVPFEIPVHSGASDHRVRLLLERINACSRIQEFMNEVSSDMRSVIYCYSEYMYQQNLKKTQSGFNPQSTYAMVLKRSLYIGTNENIENSGSVLVHDINNVLAHGNIRERCTIFQNYLFKDRYHRIMSYLMAMYAEGSSIPLCVDYKILGSFMEHIEAHNQAFERSSNLKHIICDTFKTRKRKTRYIRKNMEGYGIHVENVVPMLSSRECNLIKSRQPLSDVVPWKTGRMTWVINEKSMFAQNAKYYHKPTIAGPSGHTHSMLCFMKLLRNFNLKKWVLVCILWLVGCEHHTIYEVLVIAKTHHNLEYNPAQDCCEFVDSILNELDNEI
jgi:hypothetical protein